MPLILELIRVLLFGEKIHRQHLGLHCRLKHHSIFACQSLLTLNVHDLELFNQIFHCSLQKLYILLHLHDSWIRVNAG
jgi:hypothetical protein